MVPGKGVHLKSMFDLEVGYFRCRLRDERRKIPVRRLGMAQLSKPHGPKWRITCGFNHVKSLPSDLEKTKKSASSKDVADTFLP